MFSEEKHPSASLYIPDAGYMPCKYMLYAQPNSYIFTLKQAGEEWLKEFNSIYDAIAYAGTLPGSDLATVCVFDPTGTQLAELRVRDDALATS